MKLVVLLAVIVVAANAIRYDGYRVLEVGPVSDPEKIKLLAELADKDQRLKQVLLFNDYIKPGVAIHFAVSPESFDRVSTFIHEYGVAFRVVNYDLQQSFDELMHKNEEARIKWLESGSKAAPTVYLSYQEQVDWLTSSAAASPYANTFDIGQSYEGRNMIGMMINGDHTQLPAIWMDANVHAREWLSSATMLWVINEILTGTSNDAIALRSNFRWYIIPNGNPDGYDYSRTTDNMWRKNRGANSGSTCNGTDINRNWDENWGAEGASTNPCDDTYRGDAAFSEPEALHMSNYMGTIQQYTNLMITFHTYGQFVGIPWSVYDYKPPDYNELLRVGNLAANAIQSVNGLVFQVGTPMDLGGTIKSGVEMDWTKAQAEMAWSYTLELRPNVNATNGFHPPESEIPMSGAEIFAAVATFAREVTHKWPPLEIQ